MTSTRRLPAVALVATLVAGCSLLSAEQDEKEDARAYDPEVSMTAAGERLALDAGLARSAPRYDVRAEILPGKGAVDGTVRGSVPVDDGATQLSWRYFAGLPDFEADAELGRVTVDGKEVPARREASIVTVPLPDEHGDRVEVVLPFSYRLQASEPPGLLGALGGMGGPADVGLLGRHPDALSLGHWFPVWVPPGNNVDPDPSGYGDIGNFPAALIRARLTVPAGWTVVDGGVRTGTETVDGTTTVMSEGYGMRDLVVSVLRGYVSKEARPDGLPGLTVTAWAPTDARGELDGVLAETVLALETLSEKLVGYPWREFDVVSAPLGAGVAGMEWPGATWIATAVFSGGIPGLEGLGDLESLDGLEELLGGETGLMLETSRMWTIAHEVGHEWWHVLVGNDSIQDPSVDEPLAQYSACLVVRASGVPNPDALCAAHITTAYEQMRLLGTRDGAAARETDEFASSLQYAGLVYGKAAAFYPALEEELGRRQVVQALQGVARSRAFETLTSVELRAALTEELAGGEFARLWQRWMTGTSGDEDLLEHGTG